jgi:PAS domain S-box-containing protein
MDTSTFVVDHLPRALLDLIPTPVFVAAIPAGDVITANAAAERLCAGAVPASLRVALSASVRERSADAGTIADAIAGGARLRDVEATLKVADRVVPVSASIEPIQTAGVPAVIVTCFPLDRWVDTSVALRRSDRRLSLALNAARLGAWEFNPVTRRLTASAQCKANHGYPPDTDLQLQPHIVDALAPDDRDRFVAAIDSAAAGAAGFELEVPHLWPDGTHHWLFVAGASVDPECMVGVTLDISDRKRVEAALRESEQRYRAIVETASEGIWTLDEQARITFVNPRMSELIGYDAQDFLGRYKWDFVFPDDVPAVRALFERRRQGVAEAVMDIRFRHRDGREVWTMMSARPIYDAAGQFSGALDLFTDITERRRAEQALIAADRSKDEFLAMLGHELRNPLAPILTAVRLLEEKGPRQPELEKLRATIRRQTMQLSRLVDDLLDIGRIVQGKLRLDPRRVDLADIVRQAIETTAPLIERRRHTVRASFSDAPIYVTVDAARIVQAVANLLNNAAKYMDDGGEIEVAVTTDGGTAGIRVRDHGIGIPADMLDRIFTKFVQVNDSDLRARGGLGIGLALVKAIVDLHGGSVAAHSDGPATGSEFIIRLPIAP